MSRIAKSRNWGDIKPRGPQAEAGSGLIANRHGDMRGPINIFRHQYGQDWLKLKLEDDEFLEKLAITKRGRYVYYEALNFVDGRLDIGQIRDRVAAEYELVPVAELLEYFRLLEKAGVLSLDDPQMVFQ